MITSYESSGKLEIILIYVMNPASIGAGDGCVDRGWMTSGMFSGGNN